MNVSRSSLLPYSAQQMYQIIADIRSYPEFLNWCVGSEVKSENDDELIAKLIISYGTLKLDFTTQNKMIENQSIRMNLVEGPFSSLGGQWNILTLGEEASKVSLDMDFNFENALTQKLFGRVFQNVISAQLDAFEKRAEDLYGSPTF